MPTCSICPRPTMGPGCHTCGNSYCQEASYYRNAERISRAGSPARTEARIRAERAEHHARARSV